MGRETYLADLYRQSVQALTQNRTEWMGLLSSVSKYYKMSFDKNVLIYVQRPDAGLLATKMGWEKQTGRYLKAGSKGIGVVDMNNPKATLAYYFDLADTRGDYEGFRRAMSAVWSLERQYQPEILVNSANTVDCNAPVGYGGFQAVNYLEMPEEDFEEYRIRQVPHGTVHYEYYKSNSTGRTKLCYVYTPAGYEEHLEKRYPVLYLQHGGGENEVGWIWQGKLANIADNLIAKGQMKEMIVVMNTGYAFPENGEYHHSMSAFLQELPESCVPYIDSRYRTIADKDYRALAGLSMGGMQTQRIVFTYPELFGWAGIFSGGLVIRDDEVDYTEVLLNPEAFRKQFHMLFVACGKQEWSYESTVKNEKEVLAAGVPIEVFEGYGYHDWTFWRHCLNAFLRKLF